LKYNKFIETTRCALTFVVADSRQNFRACDLPQEGRMSETSHCCHLYPRNIYTQFCKILHVLLVLQPSKVIKYNDWLFQGEQRATANLYNTFAAARKYNVAIFA